MEELMPAIEILDRLCVEYRILKVSKFYVLYFIASSSIINELQMYSISHTTKERAKESKNGIVYLILFSDDCTIYSTDTEKDYNDALNLHLKESFVKEVFGIRPILKLLNL